MSEGNLYKCKKCGSEKFWAFDYPQPEAGHTCCGASLLHITTDLPDREEQERMRNEVAKHATPTPHVAAFYRRAQDENPTLPDPVPMWFSLGRPVQPGTYPILNGLLVVHRGPQVDPVLFIGPLEAKMILAGFREKPTFPVQISFRSAAPG